MKTLRTDAAPPRAATAEPTPTVKATGEAQAAVTDGVQSTDSAGFRDSIGTAPGGAARRALRADATPIGTAGALQSPRRATGPTVPVTRASQAPTTTGAPNHADYVASYNREIEAHRTGIHRAIEAGQPVKYGGGTARWAGTVLSIPTQLVVVNARLIEGATDELVAWNKSLFEEGGFAAAGGVLLAPVSAVLFVLGKLIGGLATLLDLPFAAMRRGLASTAAERDAPRGEASHMRVAEADWPSLPTNAAARERVRTYVEAGDRSSHAYDVIVVPGYTEDDTKGPLSDRAKARLERAASDLEEGLAPFILVSGSNVHPPGTEYNEAYEMRRYLINELGVAADRILVEPQAAHSTTNLRNSGRMMHRLGLRRAVVTSSPQVFGQSWYFQTADAIGFGIHSRTERDLGTRLGELRRVDRWHTAFDASDAVHLVTLDEGRVDEVDP